MSGGEIDWASLNDTLDETEIEPEEGGEGHSDLAPAVSLTSLNISRRRPKGRARFEKTAYLPIGKVDDTDPEPVARVERPPTPAAPPEPAPAGRDPAAAVPQTPSAAPPSGAAPRRRQEIPANLFNYWKDLRGSRRYASLADLDQGLIASQWPSSLLLKFAAGSQRPQIVKLSASEDRPLGAPATPKQEMAIDYTPLMSEWILDLGRRLVESGVPIHETETFPTKHGDVRYRVLVLPLSNDQNRVDHALYHIANA